MSARKSTPLHDFWHKRVDGQIKHTMGQHPEWFKFSSERERKTIINSLSKRIVGEIVACLGSERSSDVSGFNVDRREKMQMSTVCLPSEEGCLVGALSLFHEWWKRACRKLKGDIA